MRLTRIIQGMMKRINHPNGYAHRRTAQLWRARMASSLAETAAHLVLALVGLAAVVMALSWACSPVLPPANSVTGREDGVAAEPFSMDRFIADVRTATTLVRYLLEPESRGASNLSGAASTQQPGVMPPTNAATAKPRA